MNTAIIAAGGRGSRFNSERPKQFVEILGKPILVHTVGLFDSCDLIDEIVVVVPADDVEAVEKLIADQQFTTLVKVIAGGDSRAMSVLNGINAANIEAEIVAVHDAARPLVTVAEISKTIAAAAEFGAACLVAEVTDTIKTIRANEIVGTVDRNKLRRALTPQAFRADIIKKAFETELDERATDECYLVEKLGFPIVFVDGSAENIKITHPSDIILAENILSKRSDV